MRIEGEIKIQSNIYCLQVGQPGVRVFLWSSKLAWTGRSYKGSSHNLLAQERGGAAENGLRR